MAEILIKKKNNFIFPIFPIIIIIDNNKKGYLWKDEMKIYLEEGSHLLKFRSIIHFYSTIQHITIDDNFCYSIFLKSKVGKWKIGTLIVCLFIIIYLRFNWTFLSLSFLFILLFSYLFLWCFYELLIRKKYYKIEITRK